MKQLFTYPLNPGTYYVDPDNIGDGTYGMSERVSDLLIGSAAGKKNWSPGLNPITDLGQTWETVTPYLSRYVNYLDASSPDPLSTYDMWLNPIVNVPLREMQQALPAEFRSIKYPDGNWNTGIYITAADLLTFRFEPTTGSKVKFGGVTTYGADYNGQIVYLEIAESDVAGTLFRVWTDISLTTQLPAGTRPSGAGLIFDQVRFVRHGSGVRAVQNFDETPVFKTGDTVKFTQLFANANAGDLSNTADDFYVNYGSTNDPTGQSFRLWADAGYSTPVAVTEAYLDNTTLSYTNSTGSDATYTLLGIDVTGKTALINYLIAHGNNALCRVWYNNLTGGTITTPVGTLTQPIGDALSYTQTFWVKYNSGTNTINIVEDIADPTNTRAQFTLTDGTSVDIHIDTIDAIHFDTVGAELYPSMSFSDTGDYWTPYYLDQAFKEAGDPEIKLPGNVTYSYKDTGNNTVYAGLVTPNIIWLPGNTSFTFVPTDEFPEFTVEVSPTTGRLQSVTAGPDRGSFLTTYEEFAVELKSPANQYIPPTPYEPDVWDTEDQWLSAGYSADKLWPEHVKPQSAKLTVSQPASVNRSQNGTKYVRSSGVLRYQLEVTYPPMSQTDFEKFMAVVEAARGQTTPFYFRLRGVGSKQIILANDDHTDITGTTRLRQAYATVSGDKTVTLEGFQPNTTNAIVPGQHIIAGNATAAPNGGVVMSISEADSNVFGEVKFRMPYALAASIQTGAGWYINPAWVTVTLAQDTLEYSIDTDNLHRFKVIFDLDSWK